MKRVLGTVLLLASLTVRAQVSDNFSDGNFSSAPAWSGTGSSFTVNAGSQLQLSAAGAGEAYLSTADTLLSNTEWSFYVRLGFSPSSSNFMRYYLSSDKADLSGSLRGYYIQIGEAGNTDGVDLYRQDSLNSKLLINGSPGRAAKSNNVLRIRVTRDGTGNWAVYTDSVGGTQYVPEGQILDNTYSLKRYTGMYAKFTASDATKFYWDDILVRPWVLDKTPPELITVRPIDSVTIEVDFSEAVDSVTATDAGHYLVDSVSTPLSITLLSADKSKARLKFGKRFSSRTQHYIQVNSIKDESGNTMQQPVTLSFFYYQAEKGDVVINEIMTDPTPSVGLPEKEFVELFNATPFNISLDNWTVSDGSSNGIIPADTLKAGGYLILASDTAAFRKYGNAMSVKSFPSLNNSGDHLSLRDNTGYLVDEVGYSDAWYRDGVKKNGGYTLERINPYEPCKQGENWQASFDISGGTPGAKNSVFSSIPDTVGPSLLIFAVSDSSDLEITFNEPVDSISTAGATYFLNSKSFAKTIALSPDRKVVVLHFLTPLQSGIPDTLAISGLADCLGNKSGQVRMIFTYTRPVPAERFDVVIDEVMSKPLSTMIPARYVELKNQSGNPVSLKDWLFRDAVNSTRLPATILLPDSVVVLCSANDSAALRPFCANLLPLKYFPTLNITSDSLFLLDNHGKLIHFLWYTEDWHADDLKRAGGWSLEMRDLSNVCNPEGNWTSSRDPMGGTPGRTNSVNGSVKDKTAPHLVKVIPLDSLHLKLFFSEPIDSAEAADVRNYSLTDNTIKIISAIPANPDFRTVSLTLGDPLTRRTIYGLEAKLISDCQRNSIEDRTVSFGLPERPDTFDVVVNEILFNPETGGVDFVELYNRSDKVIDLHDLLIATTDEYNSLRSPKSISADGYLLLRGSYCVLTPDSKTLSTKYHIPAPEAVLDVAGFPALSDDKGVVVICRADDVRIDQVNYSDEWHFSLLTNHEGVSLEKINPALPSQSSSSWHSAASTAGYATPTYLNSQYQALGQAAHPGSFTLEPAVFSPDDDGYQDVLNIQYAFSKAGFMATIEVYDSEGRKVRTLANNYMLGSSGYLYWDGLTDRAEKARIGIYVILVTAFHPDGEKETYKLAATLTGKFR